MSLLKVPPVVPVESLAELFAIASAVAQEAMARYAEMAERMREAGQFSLAYVFEGLAAAEARNRDNVARRSRQQNGRGPNPIEIRGMLSHTFDDEGAGTCDPQLLTSYRALSMAVRNEERSFAFWSYVAAHARASDVQREAETLAREELEHMAILRGERRRAFHVERVDQTTDAAGTEAVVNLAVLERRLADLIEALAIKAEPARQYELMKASAQARRHAQELASSPMVIAGASPIGRVPDEPVALAEFLADRYLHAADILREEGALGRAQALAERAVSRLVLLKQKPSWSVPH